MLQIQGSTRDIHETCTNSSTLQLLILKIITYHEALKYKATSFLPPNADAVGTPDVFGFVNNFGPKRSVLQLADVAAMIDVG